MPASLTVRVNDDLMLDGGTCEEVAGPEGPELLIRPPRTTLFPQVLAYLREKPDPITKFQARTPTAKALPLAQCASVGVILCRAPRPREIGLVRSEIGNHKRRQR
jgi:hypothetical protein